MAENTPLFSIITACRNAAQYLQHAIDSLGSQTIQDFEHIVIDGASTDGTQDIIGKNQGRIASWVSEPDCGYAEAWNKGLGQARGGIIGFLNADDLYEKHTLETVKGHLSPDERTLTYGTTRFFRTDPRDVVLELPGLYRRDRVCRGFGFMHTTCFVPRIVYDEVGRFDTRYSIAADSDHLLRCLRRSVKFRFAGNVTYMRFGGMSDKRDFVAHMQFYRQLAEQGFGKLHIAAAFVAYMKNKLKAMVAQPT